MAVEWFVLYSRAFDLALCLAFTLDSLLPDGAPACAEMTRLQHL